MINIEFSDKIKKAAPHLKVLQIEARLSNPPTSDRLWLKIGDSYEYLRSNFKLEDINKRPAIAATRAAYKACGKDPNRYRPSAEALCRRVINGKGLYRLTTLIDIINLVSIDTGYSIGGFDADKIEGDRLILGVGEKDEVFNAIGRGSLNIEGLPVYRDGKGAIGTPTSDEERTKLTPETSHLLMLVNIYGDDEKGDVNDLLNYIYFLLTRFANQYMFAYALREACPAADENSRNPATD